MKVEFHRNALLVVPENEQDRSYIADSLGMVTDGCVNEIKRVNDVSMGFARDDAFALKVCKIERK